MAELWEVAYPAGNTLRITNDLNYYAGTSITGDDVTLATTQLSFSSSLSVVLPERRPFRAASNHVRCGPRRWPRGHRLDGQSYFLHLLHLGHRVSPAFLPKVATCGMW